MSQNDINEPVHINDFINTDDDNYENDDLITFELDSKKINFYYSKLTKYSKRIRDKYLFSHVKDHFPQELQQFQEESNLSLSSIFCFYQILQQNFDINENSNFKYNQCADILKISKEFKIRKLKKQMNDYINSHSNEVDFVIDMIQYENQKEKVNNKPDNDIKPEIEEILRNKIEECLSNDKFAELPIETIYRIIEKCDKKIMISDKLFDFIKKSINKYYILFQFVEAEQLSEDHLLELCDLYSKMDQQSKYYFNYMRFNLNLLSEMLNKRQSLELINQFQQNKMAELETINQSQQNKMNELETINQSQQNKMNELENQMSQIQMQFQKLFQFMEQQKNSKNDEYELAIKQLNSEIKELRETADQLNKKLKISEEEKDIIEKSNKELQEKLDKELSPFKAVIIPNVKNGLIINARIKLVLSKGTLDSSLSKYIVSTSDAKTIGPEAYQKGGAITSLDINTVDFICKSGIYFVRCIVFTDNGLSQEFVSNKVTTSGTSLLFGFKGEQEEFSILPGKYKLEVWGGQGGDSTGKRYKGHEDTQNGKGGLGGYSCGILKLNEMEKIHVFVGGAGREGSSSDGDTTEGSFPDGGGTKTGHSQSGGPTSVPGTGGGSTSIRLINKTDYHRVIVAGGGGGASGNSISTDSGGFGGGTTGGNVCYFGSITNQGSGTQTGSTCGLGYKNNGDPGEFGKGATGKYMQGRDSGGGGGGGWYGGGSGGYGGTWECSSGGGGSGWVFTESSFNEWQKGDFAKSSKFLLNSAYHLTDALTLNGDQELPLPNGNGTEKGHRGNGYAKITIE